MQTASWTALRWSDHRAVGAPEKLLVQKSDIWCKVDARRELGAYFRFYNNQRSHQALSYRTPAEVFHGDPTVRREESKYRRCSDGPVSGSYSGATGPSLNSALILSK